jgi:hypothetical protein
MVFADQWRTPTVLNKCGSLSPLEMRDCYTVTTVADPLHSAIADTPVLIHCR